MQPNTGDIRRTTGGESRREGKERNKKEKRTKTDRGEEKRQEKGKARAQMSRTERRTKTGAMWIVVNDRVQLNEAV